MNTLSEKLQAGLSHHQAGRLHEAESAYREVLQRAPDHADAWHLLGAVACQAGRVEESVEYLHRAIALSPDVGIFHNSLGNALQLLGRIDAAIDCYRRAVACQADLAEAHKNLGQTLSIARRFGEAAESFQQALKLRPDDPEVQRSLLNVALNEVVRTQRPPELPSVADSHAEGDVAGPPQTPDHAAAEPAARYDLVILVPYRDRLDHLRQFSSHMDRFFRGKLSFRIVVVEQAPGTPFNRGKLLNVGFRLHRDEAPVFALHDVDTLPQDESCDYRIADRPIHLAGRASKYGGQLPYPAFLGAVFVLRREHFEAANGFSNLYWGWGREDDEFARRLWASGITWENLPGRYQSLEHPPGDLSSRNDARLLEFLRGERDWRRDGLCSLDFEIIRSITLQEFLDAPMVAAHHQLITVDLGHPG